MHRLIIAGLALIGSLALASGCGLPRSTSLGVANVVKLTLNDQGQLAYANGSTSLAITEPSADASTRFEVTGGGNSTNLALVDGSGKEVDGTIIQVTRSFDNNQPTGTRTTALPPGNYTFVQGPRDVPTGVKLAVTLQK